jgi:hypothetical protein
MNELARQAAIFAAAVRLRSRLRACRRGAAGRGKVSPAKRKKTAKIVEEPRRGRTPSVICACGFPLLFVRHADIAFEIPQRGYWNRDASCAVGLRSVIRATKFIGQETCMLSTILIIILILLLIGGLPTWPYSSGWGYYPSGGIGLILLIIIILALLGRL